MSQFAVPAPVEAERRAVEERRWFLNWLICWVLLPNLPFLAVTLLGGPPRYPEIVICAATGLALRRAPYWLKAGAFAAMLGWLAVSFIARMFNMNVTMILSVLGLVFDISPAVSPEYVAGAGLIAVSLVAGCLLMRRRSDFTAPRWLFASIAVLLGTAGADFALSREAMGSYSRLAPTGAPFSSSTRQADLLGLADGKANILLVVVEAMGEPRDPALRAQLDRMWMRPELAARYEMVRGTTPFYGSTTSGEMRELCQRWGDYPELTTADPRCIPALLKARGYQTKAIHAFHPGFFERRRWYPLIGFDRSIFGRELMADGASLCPNVFPGACDRDVPPLIARQLRRADKPQFLYWLTLNSHLPIIADRRLGTEDCAELGSKRDQDFPMICRLFALWEDTADSLARTLSQPDLPPTHVLIVGDHMPPFTHQRSRLQFDAERVPWILLRYRGEASASQSSAAAR